MTNQPINSKSYVMPPKPSDKTVTTKASEAAMHTIISDPVVVEKMKDYIRKNTKWEPVDDPLVLAGQVVLAEEQLHHEYDRQAKKMFPSDHSFHTYKKSGQYHHDRTHGTKEIEHKNGFRGFDDEHTSHLTPLAVASGVLAPWTLLHHNNEQHKGVGAMAANALKTSLMPWTLLHKKHKNFEGDAYAHLDIPTSPVGAGLQILKGGFQLAQKIIANAKAKKAGGPVDTSVKTIGTNVANSIKTKKASQDKMASNSAQADTLHAQNAALQAGAPHDVVSTVTDPKALAAITSTYNQLTGGSTVAPTASQVDSKNAPLGTPPGSTVTPDAGLNPQPSGGMNPVMIIGLVVVAGVIIYFATKGK